MDDWIEASLAALGNRRFWLICYSGLYEGLEKESRILL